ncbi:outer membrane beta-barrel protein [Roseivirga pacifica]|uniref:outer membrane beta-barrel protein n=1 Tax=Roseivirga pacifica TaxID=1267423 RepID=UPI00227B09A9|nr:outer membrane beta-barrel protein [Roseivirga pacifica]
MKKLILAITFLSFYSLANAQIQKGDIQVGGTVSYSKSKIEGSFDREIQQFNLTPRAGLFVSDLTSIGLQLGYSSTKIDDSKESIFSIGAYSRFHKAISDNLYIFFQPGIAFGTGSDDDQDTDISTFDFSFVPGITYFLTPKLAAEASFGRLYYSQEKRENDTLNLDTTESGISINPETLTIGLSYYFR